MIICHYIDCNKLADQISPTATTLEAIRLRNALCAGYDGALLEQIPEKEWIELLDCLGLSNFGCDLRLLRDPLQSRLYPANLHHWSKTQFDFYLEKFDFPLGTRMERQASRQHAIAKALAEGLSVPDVVTEEEPWLIEEGQALRAYDDAAGCVLTAFKRKVAEFEALIGYTASRRDYEQRIAALLMLACAGGGAAIDFDGCQVNVSRQSYTLHGTGRGYGRECRDVVLVKPSAESLYVLHQFSYPDVAEPILCDLLAQQRVTLDEIRVFAGYHWQTRPLVVAA